MADKTKTEETIGIPEISTAGQFDWTELYRSEEQDAEHQGEDGTEFPHSKFSPHTEIAYHSNITSEQEINPDDVPEHFRKYLEYDNDVKIGCCARIFHRSSNERDALLWEEMHTRDIHGAMNSYTSSKKDRMFYAKEMGIADHCRFCPASGIPIKMQTRFQKNRRICHLLCEDQEYNVYAKVISVVMAILVAISIITFIAETDPTLQPETIRAFFAVEGVICVVFTVEYVVRFLVAAKKIRWFMNLWNMIDLMSIVPYYIEVALGDSSDIDISVFRVFRSLRLFRVVRLLEVGGFRKIEKILKRTIFQSLPALCIFLGCLILVLTILSSLMWSFDQSVIDTRTGYLSRCEIAQQPADCPLKNLTSIPQAMWWGIQTLTAEGYGDVFPVQWYTQLIGLCTAIMGIMVLSLPIAIMSTFFIESFYEVSANAKTIDTIVTELRKKEIDLKKRCERIEKILNREVALAKIVTGHEDQYTDTHGVWHRGGQSLKNLRHSVRAPKIKVTRREHIASVVTGIQFHQMLVVNNIEVLTQLRSLIRFLETSRMGQEDTERVKQIDPSYWGTKQVPWFYDNDDLEEVVNLKAAEN